MSETLKPKPHRPIPGKVRTPSQIQRDEHVGHNEAVSRYRAEQLLELEGKQAPLEPISKPLARDPITGRFVSNKNVTQPETVINNNVSELNKFAEKAIGKTKQKKQLSPRTKKSVERVIANIVNIAATKEGAAAFLNEEEQRPVTTQEIKDLFEQEDGHKEQKKSTSSTTNTTNILHNSEVVKDKSEENNLLHEIAHHTAATAEAVKKTQTTETKKVAETKKNERIEKASGTVASGTGKKSKKEERGFFEDIAYKVKNSPGGKFVKSVGGIGRTIQEGGAAGVGRAAVAAAPYVLTAGIIAMVVKGVYDRFQANKRARETGIPAETAGVDNVPESEQPDTDKVKDVIKNVEGDNGEGKPGERFATLSKEERAKAFEAAHVPEADVTRYERKQDLLKQNKEYKEKLGRSTIGPTLLNRDNQYDRGRRGFDSSSQTTNSSGRPLASSGGFMQQEIQDPNISPEGKALLDTISTHESGGDYNVRQGGSHIDDLSQFPTGMGKGGISSASGKYQFLRGTWGEAAKALGLKDFSPDSQDKAAWWLAQRDYHKHTGGNLAEDVKSKDPSKQLAIANALHGTWTSLPGGYDPGLGKAGRNSNEYLQTLNANTKRYDSVPASNDTGTKLAEATTQNKQMADKLTDAPAPVVVSNPTNVTQANSNTPSAMPSVRNDDPVLLRALQTDIKQA